jgi:hypothetical protein
MEIYIYVAGLDADGESVAALVDAGFDDALITQDRHGGTGTIELEVEQFTAADVDRCIAQVEAAGVRVRGFGPPALVSAADVADRIGRSRQSVGQLARGERGPGGFPVPVNPGGRAEHYAWPEVVEWLRSARIAIDATDAEVEAARTVLWANDRLRHRAIA